jgi:hypothetical protein
MLGVDYSPLLFPRENLPFIPKAARLIRVFNEIAEESNIINDVNNGISW